MIFYSKITFYTNVMSDSIFWLAVDVRKVQFYRLVLMLTFEAHLYKKYLLVMKQTGI